MVMNFKKLVICVGLPCSGKSTWAKQQNLPIVNPNSIRLALHGLPYVQEAEDFVWAIARVMVRSLLIAGNNEVIIDATNITEKRRDYWADFFTDCEIKFKYFDTPVEVCIERAKNNDRDDLVPVIIRMAGNQEPNMLFENSQ